MIWLLPMYVIGLLLTLVVEVLPSGMDVLPFPDVGVTFLNLLGERMAWFAVAVGKYADFRELMVVITGAGLAILTVMFLMRVARAPLFFISISVLVFILGIFVT